MQRALLGLMLLGIAGCDDVVKDIANGVDAPEAALNRVDLVHAPTVLELTTFTCHETLGSGACGLAGLNNKPGKKKLEYNFDIVFDLSNPNDSLPIPLVDILLGMNVFDEANLGVVCITFCDPEDEECEPASNAAEACLDEEAETVDGAGDFVPTVDELVSIGKSVAEGETLDNGDWRVIQGGESIETHIAFDLSADTMLGLADNILRGAVDDFISGRDIAVEVPYTTEGNLYFNVPELGRHKAAFGPLGDTWILE